MVTTFLSYLTYTYEFQRVFDINIRRVLVLLDLRKENTLATWFSSMLFLMTGLAFVLLGWGSNFKNWQRFIFKLTAVGAVLLSADEVASIHETVGKWIQRALEDLITFLPIGGGGFVWVLLFAPIAIAGLIATVIALHQIVKFQRKAAIALWIAVLCLPAVFMFEILEWMLHSFQSEKLKILTCWEEMFELLGMYSLFICAVLIAGRHKL
ncbi:hypothetical protein QUF50_02770 [Thiotrichales bacterium HSG1]|nr:hypothetical protein [Thiotrichales bacterium HSG1]